MDITSLLFSVFILISTSLVTEYSSPFLGSVLASAPTGSPLSLYYAYSSSAQPAAALISATDGLLLGSISTLAFACAARQSAHAGFPLYPTLAAGFFAWWLTYTLLKHLF